MRRYILGIVLLVLLPVLCLPVSKSLNSHHDQLADTLEQAALLFDRGEAEEGALLARQAYGQWVEKRSFAAVFVHHAPLEEIDKLFLKAKVLEQQELAVCCTELAAHISALSEGQGLSWWDVL